MMKNKSTRLAAFILSLLLCLQPLAAVPARAAEGEIYISSPQDLMELAGSCSLDTWSQGKTVILTRDISLSGTDFSPIPTFGGTFDGGGHSITGLELCGSLSPAGLFCSIQEGGTVRDLNVSGSVAPAGDGDSVGGIAGINMGLIERCSFSGTVTGVNCIGGIAGVNEATGKIRGCVFSGTVTGKSMAGGIAGCSHGLIESCRNNGSVNVAGLDPGVNLTDLNVSMSGDLLTLRALDTFNVSTDTGGIAGYSSGMILSCANSGAVGYPHVGYNVGGIAGRTCGHISGCVNRGQIFGRKDIGGIAGQAEPDIILSLTDDKLRRVQNELDSLETMVDRTASDTDRFSDEIHGHFSAIGDITEDASGYVRDLRDRLYGYGDGLVSEIDRTGDIIVYVLGRLTEISDDALTVSVQLGKALDDLEAGIEELSKAGGPSEEALRELKEAGEEIGRAAEKAENGITLISGGLDELEKIISPGDKDAIRSSLGKIQDGVSALGEAMGILSSAMDSLADVIVQLGGSAESGDWENVQTLLPELSGALASLSSALSDAAAALGAIGQGLAEVQDNISVDLEHLQPGLDKIEQGLSALADASSDADEAINHAKSAIARLEGISAQFNSAMDKFADAMDILSDTSGTVSYMLFEFRELFVFLSSVDPIHIQTPDGELQDSADSLLSTLELLGGHMEALNDSANAITGSLTADIRAISSQFGAVTDTLLDLIRDAESGSADDLVSDTSEIDVDAVTDGKLLSCQNEGEVSGDISVGGIAGTMAVEYELDPEGDLISDTPFYRREYEFKAILQRCVNRGSVTSRRDKAGGLCGQMELGLISACESYGAVTSETGDYVGGIVGLSSGTVRDSWAKCALSGRDYVGGITGWLAENGSLLGCRSLVRIYRHEQYAGAIAGDSSGTLRDNLFVSDGIAGVNLVSSAGKSEPVSYEELLNVKGLPGAFRRFTLRFLASGTTLRELTFNYGDSFEGDIFPLIPAKEGCFARWDTLELSDLRFDTDVNAVYTPYISALESGPKRSGGRSVFLAEGMFSEGDSISARLLTAEALDAHDLPGKAWAGKRAFLERWRLELPGDSILSHTIHYLAPDSGSEKIGIYVYENGQWRPAETQGFGSYLIFRADGHSLDIAVVSVHSAWWVWPAAALFAAAAALLVIFAVKSKKRRKRKANKEDLPVPRS